MMKKATSILCLLTILLWATLTYGADNTKHNTTQIAVASNFVSVLKPLAQAFKNETGNDLLISHASSGKLYAQIRHGAPFHLFLSADQEKTSTLLTDQLAVEGSEFTYAIGQLALWSANPEVYGQQESRLRKGKFNKLALANPKLAPYGVAALETLKNLMLERGTRSKWVRGENITQTYQFVATQNADLGFVALSQIINDQNIPKESYWLVPERLYNPIKQNAVLLKTGEKNHAAISFMAFLKSPVAQKIINTYGYLIPTNDSL